jgi:hypothetical protein
MLYLKEKERKVGKEQERDEPLPTLSTPSSL